MLHVVLITGNYTISGLDKRDKSTWYWEHTAGGYYWTGRGMSHSAWVSTSSRIPASPYSPYTRPGFGLRYSCSWLRESWKWRKLDDKYRERKNFLCFGGSNYLVDLWFIHSAEIVTMKKTKIWAFFCLKNWIFRFFFVEKCINLGASFYRSNETTQLEWRALPSYYIFLLCKFCNKSRYGLRFIACSGFSYFKIYLAAFAGILGKLLIKIGWFRKSFVFQS